MIARSPSAEGTSAGFALVAWSRGAGCLELATLLGGRPPIQVKGDLRRSCIKDRIELLVTRRLSSFDLVPIVIPHHLELERVESVTAAVGDGPHSELAAAVGSGIGAALGVPAELATVYRTPEEITVALARLERLAEVHPDIGRRAVDEPTAKRLVESLAPGTLLVVGAPGGSWLQRQLFGTGHRLLVTAPSGAIVVRSAPRRCYQDAADPAGIAIGGHLTVKDALALMRYPVVPVCEGGRLVGTARIETLVEKEPTLLVADVMEPPVAVADVEPVAAAADLDEFFGNSPIPVVDSDGYLIGTIFDPPPHSLVDFEISSS